MNEEKCKEDAILKALVDLANSERRTVWARNASMLVANALILNAMAFDRFSPAWALPFLGLVLCFLWLVMSNAGWSIIRKRSEQIVELSPTVGKGLNIGQKTDVIKLVSWAMIAVVALMYIPALVEQLCFEQ